VPEKPISGATKGASYNSTLIRQFPRYSSPRLALRPQLSRQSHTLAAAVLSDKFNASFLERCPDYPNGALT
jgi:hypothetical protein